MTVEINAESQVNDVGSLAALKTLVAARSFDIEALRTFLLMQDIFSGHDIQVALSSEELAAGASGGTVLFEIQDSVPGSPYSGQYVLRYDLKESGIYQDVPLRAQFETMRAVKGAGIPAPDAIWLDEEERIVPGTSALIMRRILAPAPTILYLQEGMFVHAAPEIRRAMLENLVRLVVQLQTIDPETLDVPSLRIRGGEGHFTEREICWCQAELHAKFPPIETDERAALHSQIRKTLDDAADWLRVRAPRNRQPVLVHGDVTLANTMFNADGTVKALLDWELAHFGLPAEDITYMTAAARSIENVGGTRASFPDASELRALYEKHGGCTDDWEYCDALNCWRVGIAGAIGMRRMPRDFWGAQERMWICHRDALEEAMRRYEAAHPR